MRGKRSKDCDIDLGLAVAGLSKNLGALRNTRLLTADVIASFCGCSRTAIQLIERPALRKMRFRLSRDPEMVEALKVMATQ
jgi:hypothetical protein